MPQCAIITGGRGTLGKATADAFRQAGWRVTLIDKPPSNAAASEEHALGELIDADLQDGESATNAMTQARARMGGLHALINIAGAFQWQRIMEGSAEVWSSLFGVNLLTCLHSCRAAIGHLEQGGSIINVGAAAAARAEAGMAAYASAKSAVARLTEALALELQDRHIRVNAVLPRVIDTPRNRQDMPDQNPAAWTAPAAIAEVILFLASSRSRALNGSLVEATNASPE
jgi:NAD(P)-dependent dehydrogenase (short-subunit alcohol dehydrogenase family)